MENNNAQIIPIVLATDSKFAPYCSVAICSLISNASPEREYYVYVFQDSLSGSDITILEEMSTENVQVRCLDVSGHVRPDLMYESDIYPRPIYFRLFIPELLPQFEKVIYLDSDVVVVSDVAELWEIDMKEMVIGAVQDIQHRKRQKEVSAQLGMNAWKYFNSGVLLINCRAFREEQIKERCFYLLANHKKFLLPDQDALNLACLNKVYYLPARWNLLTYYGRQPYYIRKNGPYNRFYKEAQANPGILHYAGGYKPFESSYLGINSVFWRYAAGSPWFLSIFTEWIENDKKRLFPQELCDMSRDIMSTGQCGWRGFLEIFDVALRSRIAYLYRQRRKKQ